MNKGLEALERLMDDFYEMCRDLESNEEQYQRWNLTSERAIIEQELKEAEENKVMLDIFKNALTVERQIPPELEIKESEKGVSYVFKEAVKIHENRIEEMYKKALREWVLKNAFLKELKALEIIKNKRVDVELWRFTGNRDSYNRLVCEDRRLTEEEHELLKEVLK